MPAIITEAFRVFNAKEYKDSLATSNTYFGIGRQSPWGEQVEEDGQTASEINPPYPVPSSRDFFNAWRDMIALKKLTSNRASLQIPRHNWTSGTVYSKADSRDPSIFQRKFYVMNSKYRLYKCIDNNGGVPSVNEPDPNGTAVLGSQPFTTADGYKWVYLRQLTPLEIDTFLTDQHIPVPDPTMTSPSTPGGAIDSATIVSGGAAVSGVSVSIIGDGTGATATATVAGGVVTKINITARGSGYTWARFSFTGTNSTSIVAYPNISPNGGHGYSVAQELGAFYVTMNCRLEYSEGGKIPTNNEYRKIQLVRNPTVSGTNTVVRAYGQITVNSVPSSFVTDQIITGNNNSTARIIDVVGNVIRVNQLNGNVSAATTFSIGPDSATKTAYTKPEATPYSGFIDYLEYRRPISRSNDQVEELRITIEW